MRRTDPLAHSRDHVALVMATKGLSAAQRETIGIGAPMMSVAQLKILGIGAPVIEFFRPEPGSRAARDAEVLRAAGARLARDLDTDADALRAVTIAFAAMTEEDRETIRRDLRAFIAERRASPDAATLPIAPRDTSEVER